MIAPTAIETITLGTRIVTEFQKPTRRPLQVRPVQADDHAFTQASKVGASGSENIEPWRISSIVFSDVTTIM